jgi:site-specific DNA-methyltransferase (adenine-specific)/site-specific DNA-methyltransferase (cytosine-N4-specific)
VGKESVLPGNTVKVALVGKNMGHPAAFPVGLPEFFIKLFTKTGDNVLDPFAGSGSTGLAAEKLNRNVVLIDNKEDYFKTMQNRLRTVKPDRERSFKISQQKTEIEYYAMPTMLESKKRYLVGKNLRDSFPEESS